MRKFCRTNTSQQAVQPGPVLGGHSPTAAGEFWGEIFWGDKTGMFCLEDLTGATAPPLRSRERRETPASPPTSPMVHDARVEEAPREKAPLNTDVCGTLHSTTQPVAGGAATCTYPRDAEGNRPAAKGSQNRKTPFYAPFKPLLHFPPNRCRVPDLESIPRAPCATVPACQHQPSKPACGR